MTAFWLVLAFLGGVAVTLILQAVGRNRPPPPPKPPPCTAVLRSGEYCVHALGHDGPHRAYINQGLYTQQAYVWEDPQAGVWKIGFF